MGTDIQVHTEVVLTRAVEASWQYYSSPFIKRWYSLFAKMADVRNDGHERELNPLRPAVGLPADCSLVTRAAYEDDGGSSTVYVLDRGQVQELERWYDKIVSRFDEPHGFNGEFDYLVHDGWSRVPDDVFADCRFVFWFD
jgi:hypothetical protein